MPKTRQQKEEAVVSLTDKLGRIKSAIFADYKGLTTSEINDLKEKLRDKGAEFTITKNSLLKLAFNNAQLTINNDQLFAGPTATLFAYDDEITPIKLLVKLLKDTQKGSVKAGLFDGEMIDPSEVNKLAQLPSREELQTKLVGGLGAPIYGIVGVLQANLRNLIYTLEQIRVVRGGE